MREIDIENTHKLFNFDGVKVLSEPEKVKKYLKKE